MRKTTLTLLLSILFTLCIGFDSHAAVAEGSSVTLAASTLDGKTFDLATLKGKTVIVHFWATWCPSCREEMPVLDDFYLHRPASVEVIGISLDRARERESVVDYMKAFHFPSALTSDTTANSFGTPGSLPVTYVVNAQGIVTGILTPDKTPLTRENLDKAVR